MVKKLLNWFPTIKWTNEDIPEGVWAADVKDLAVKELIQKNYQCRFPKPEPTPATHPWLFDPFSPPPGWNYDPYYEWWSKE
jgi:hypothetical protein